MVRHSIVPLVFFVENHSNVYFRTILTTPVLGEEFKRMMNFFEYVLTMRVESDIIYSYKNKGGYISEYTT